MGFFRKKETTHFERDPEGRVTQVTRNGEVVDPQELKMKSTEQLEQEYYTKYPKKRHPTLRKIGSGLQKLDKGVVKYNRTRNIMNTQQRTGRIHSGVGSVPNRPGRVNANPFGGLFDTGVHAPPKPRKKKTTKKKFTVIGGKAYPIAGTGKRKKKKTTKKRKYGFDFDPFDNSRWL